MNILISGIAGDIGQGAYQILKDWGIFKNLYGIDSKIISSNKFIYKKAPLAEHKNYVPWLKDFIEKNAINLFIPTSESEIFVLNKLDIKKIGKADLLINKSFTIEKSLDKFETLNYLKKKGIKVPTNGIVGYTKPQKYPVIVKPRYGQGSKGVSIIKNKKNLDLISPEYIWQEYLVPQNQEYTCPVYAFDNKKFTTLLIKRKLEGGMTISGVIVKNYIIQRYVNRIARAMKIRGSINIQLRMTSNGPLLFEINPRLSGTLFLRDKIGFMDLRWWISDILAMKKKKYIAPKEGTKVLRD